MKKLTRRNFLAGVISLPITAHCLSLASSGSAVVKDTRTLSVKSPSVDLSRLLACIAEVETGNDDTKIGPCGSRSRYQIHRNTWYGYTDRNFEQHCWGSTALEIAKLHLLWLNTNLARPTPYRLASAWHSGLSTTYPTSGYALRVHNLYHDSAFLTAAFLNNSNDEFATAYRSNRPQSFPTNSTG